jgi:hypothetical protein
MEVPIEEEGNRCKRDEAKRRGGCDAVKGEKSDEHTTRGTIRKTKNQMQHLLEALQCWFLLHFADVEPDPTSARVILTSTNHVVNNPYSKL